MKNVVFTGKIIKEGNHYHWRLKLKDGNRVDIVMSNPDMQFKTKEDAYQDLLKVLLKE